MVYIIIPCEIKKNHTSETDITSLECSPTSHASTSLQHYLYHPHAASRSPCAPARLTVRRSVGPSVRRSVGPSVRRSVGPSVRRSVGPSVRRSVGPSVRRSVGPSVRRSVGPSVRRSVGPSVRRSVGPSFVVSTLSLSNIQSITCLKGTKTRLNLKFVFHVYYSGAQ